MNSTMKQDLSAGIVVFVVALPLCLGIALASGAPLASGLIAGVVGGLLVAWLSGSELSVSGPAAGLTMVVAGAIAQLGTFERVLGAIFLSGVFQLIFGFIQSGSLSGFFPNAVIKGMLAAIGIVIILKQIPHALGRDTDYEGDLSFWQFTDKENTFTEIVHSIASFSPPVLFVAVTSLALMLLWPRIQKLSPTMNFVPPSIVAVVGGTVISQVMGGINSAWGISAEHLVRLPSQDTLQMLFSGTALPGLSLLTDAKVWTMGLTIALIGSIETLLCLEATDRLDPKRRTSDPNRELLAQGVGNMVCGILGGLPITSVVVRSSANIYAGAQTRWACFFHGVFLLGAVLLFPRFLNLIPLASLAAVLFAVGYKLADVKIFKDMTRRGMDQLLPFAVTCITIVFSDILTGVAVGVFLSLIVIALTSHFGAITIVNESNDYLVRFSKDVSFANKIFLRKSLAKIPNGAHVTVDGTRTMFIDNDIYDILQDFRGSAIHRKITVQLRGVRGKRFGMGNRRRIRSRGTFKTDVA